MSQANTPSFPDFGKLVPGFDFLQNLTRQATGGAKPSAPQLPGLGGWIAPTLNVEELDKRVQELKAVQFWLDQNGAALKATIQALELQKMTLATLKGMNFNMAEIANAFTLKTGGGTAAGASGTTAATAATGADSKSKDKPRTFAGLEIPPSAFQAGKAQPAQDDARAAEKPTPPEAKPEPAPAPVAAAPAAGAPASVVDPMQWWGALTQQFQTIAAQAMKEVAKTSTLSASKDAVKTATDMAAGIAKGMADTTSKVIGAGAASNWPKPDAAKAPPRASAKAIISSPPQSAARTKPKAPAARKTAGAASRKTTR